MTKTVEFVYYLVCIGTLIAALHLADVLTNLDCGFGLVRRLAFTDAA